MRVDDLDEILVSPARLAALASLADGRWHTFMDLKRATGLADGNLHVQAGKLADAGYLTRRQEPHGRRTRTSFRITEEGLLRLRLLARSLQAVLERGEGVIRPRPARGRRDDARIW